MGVTGLVSPPAATESNFTPKTIEVPLMGFTGLVSTPTVTESSFTPKTIEVPLMGFTGLVSTPTVTESSFTPKTIEVPLMGFTGFGSSSAGLYEHVNPQSPVNTALASGQPFNKERPELLGRAKPDLTTLPQLSVGGSTSRWGGSVVLSSQQVQPAENGLCSVSITYTVQNSGTAPAPAFASLLLSSANQSRPSTSQWSSFAQGAKQAKTEQVLLRPGKNNLMLYLDHTGQIDELNKVNNQVRLLVILNGVCQPQYQQQPMVR